MLRQNESFFIKNKYTLLFFLLNTISYTAYTQCSVFVEAGEDQYYCSSPIATQLEGSFFGEPVLEYEWSPTTGLSDPNSLTPFLTITESVVYGLTAKGIDFGQNLVTNGDFTAGNTGFTTDYTYSANPTFPGNELSEGFYTVSDEPAPAHVNWVDCGDHTTGNGNMMLVNGAQVPNQSAWCQTVNITPNTEYAFSAWVASVDPNGPCIIQFQINGAAVGDDNVALNQTCLWVNFFSLWNSGANTTATICIEDINTIEMGNDFAIDDVVFAPTCTFTDYVTLYINEPPEPEIEGANSLCEGSETTLSVIGEGSPYADIDWAPISSSETLTVDAEGNYFVTVTDQNGCTGTASANVEFLDSSEETIDIAICAGTDYLGFTETGMYIDTLLTANGCDSIITLNLTVDPPVNDVIETSICFGTDYLGYTETGVYNDTIVATDGCTIIQTIDLTIDPEITSSLDISVCHNETYLGYTESGTYVDTLVAVNGCDSIRTIELLVQEPITSNFDIEICQGQEYETYSATGMYTDQFLAVNGCDSTRTIHLLVSEQITQNLDITICTGETYEGYDLTGVYSDDFVTADGCDSTRILNLMVINEIMTSLDITVCNDETYEGYATSGTYTDMFSSVSGCDSIRTLNLVVADLIEENIDIFICSGDIYETYDASGNYTDVFTSASGCDSTRILNLTVADPIVGNIDTLICFGEVFEGYNTTGTYTDNFTSTDGCDSIRILNLVLESEIINTINVSICEGEIYEGYSIMGEYTDVFSSVSGCDSTRILNLTVDTEILTNLDISICAGEMYEGYTTTGTYMDPFVSTSGCDSTRTLNLVVIDIVTEAIEAVICTGEQFESYTETGVYIDTLSATSGCDSIRILDLVVNDVIISEIEWSICLGDSIGNYTETGIYEDTFVATNGCDSIRVLDLVVVEPIIENITISICAGETYESYSATNIYTDTLQSSIGCDSVRVLDLTVDNNIITPQTASICLGDTITIDTEIFTQTGQYEVMLQSAQGCDSLIQLDLMVLENEITVLMPIICQNDIYTVGTEVFDQTGQYEVTLVGENGCDSLVRLDLTVIPIDTNYLVEQICTGETFPIADQSYDEAGVYEIMTVASTGCDSIIVLDLSVVPCEVLLTTSFTNISCFGNNDGTFSISVSEGTPPFLYQTVNTTTGEFGGGSFVSMNTVLTAYNLTPGFYLYTISDSLGFSTQIEFTITQPEPLQGTLSDPQNQGFSLSCFGDEDGAIEVVAEGGTAPYNYFWNTFNSTPIIENLAASFYEVVVTDQNNCSILLEQWVTAPPILGFEILVENPDCIDTDGSILVENMVGGTAPYLIGLDDDTLEDAAIISNLEEGDYTVVLQDVNGCESLAEATILPVPNFDGNLIDALTLSLGDSIQLNPMFSSTPDSLIWEGENMSCYDCVNPFISPTSSGQYTLTAISEFGCVYQDEITIQIEKELDVYVPNAFSPNDDGVNDFFTVFAKRDILEVKSLQIFSRWGELLFSNYNFAPNDPSLGWNGFFRNQLMNPAVFVWVVEVEFIDGSTEILKGDVTLMN